MCPCPLWRGSRSQEQLFILYLGCHPGWAGQFHQLQKWASNLTSNRVPGRTIVRQCVHIIQLTQRMHSEMLRSFSVHVCVRERDSVCVCMFVRIYNCSIHSHTHTHTHTRTHTHTHTHIHTNTNTHTHIHTHTQIAPCRYGPTCRLEVGLCHITVDPD